MLGPLEKAVMEVLWGRGGATGKEVFEELRRRREIAVTTVFTVLERLYRKGLLHKTRDDGAFVFRPAYSREELARSVSREVLEGVLDLWRGSAVASIVDILASKDPDELDRLSRLIDQKKLEMEKRGK